MWSDFSYLLLDQRLLITYGEFSSLPSKWPVKNRNIESIFLHLFFRNRIQIGRIIIDRSSTDRLYCILGAKSYAAFQPLPHVKSCFCLKVSHVGLFGDFPLLCFIETLVRWLIPNYFHSDHHLGLDGRGAYPRANHDHIVFPSHPEPTGNFLFLPGEIR